MALISSKTHGVLVDIMEIMVVLLSDRVAYRSKTVEANNRAARPAHSQ